MTMMRLAAVSIVAMAMVTPAVAAFHSSVTSSGLLVLNRAGVSPIVLYAVPTLQKWKVLKDGSVWGVVSNHPSLPDGSLITTSPLTDPTKADADVMVRTQTGSTYKLAARAPPVASDGAVMGALAATVAAAILFNTIAASGPEMFTPPMLTSTDNVLIVNMKAPKQTQKESERKIKEETMLEAATMMQTMTSDERTRAETSVATTAETTIVTTTKAVEDTVETLLANTKAIVTTTTKAVDDTAETPVASTKAVVTTIGKTVDDIAEPLVANTKAVVTTSTKAVDDKAEPLVANTKAVVTTTTKALDDAVSLSKQVNAAMTNNFAPDKNMAAALAVAGIAGAAAIISSYKQGGAMKKGNESAGLPSGDPVATKTTFSSARLDSLSSLSSAAAKTTETTAWGVSSIDNMSAVAADKPVPTKTHATSTDTSSSSSVSTILNASRGGVESKAGYKPTASTGKSQLPLAVPMRSKREVIEGLKTELELAREFFSRNGVIKPAPHPVPSELELACEFLSDTGEIKSSGGVELKGSHAGYKPAASTGESQLPPAVPKRAKREVIEGLKTELELAREFFSHNGVIKPAPRPIPPSSVSNTMVPNGSDSSAFVSKDIGLDATFPVKPAPAFSSNHVSGAASGGSSVDTMSIATPGSTIADASPTECKPGTATADASSSSQVKAARAPSREVIERLKQEVELASEFLSHSGLIEPTPRPIPPGSVSNTMVSNGSDSSAFVSKDVGLDVTLPAKPAPAVSPNDVSGAALGVSSMDAMSVATSGSTIANTRPAGFKPAATTADASSGSQLKAARVPPREVIVRLKYELELARKWKNRNGVYKPVPLPPMTASSKSDKNQSDNAGASFMADKSMSETTPVGKYSAAQFNVDDQALVDLLNLCYDMGAPNYAFDRIMDWARAAHQRGYDFRPKQPSREVVLRNLAERLQLSGGSN